MTQSKAETGNIENITGDVNIAGRDIIQYIRTIHERSLTAAEEVKKARSLEGELLAEGVSFYIQGLQEQVKNELMAGAPYKALLEYHLAEAESFHGREQARQSLLEIMARGPLAVLHSESGAGKTSLLQAGIAPRLLAHGYLPLHLRPYDKSPSIEIKKAFLKGLKQSPLLAKTSLRDFLAKVLKILGKKSALFIMLDQFEEFFIRVDEKEQAAFINELGECIDDKSLNVRWLISLRSEYFGRLANFRPRIRNPYENDFLLNRLTCEEAREAIIAPAKKFKIKFEAGLVDKILDDLGKDQIVPTQLQLVCFALYKALPLGEKLLTKEIYEVREGGTNGILRGHLERVLKRLTPDKRAAARQILEALITSVQQRVLRPRADLIESLSARGLNSDDLQSAIDQLVESRLLRVEESDLGPAYELAHDYLLNEITLTPQVIKRKQAEELLEQGLSNLNKHQVLLSPDALGIIEKQRENIKIDSDEARLLFLSAVEYRRPAQKWGELISPKERSKLIASYFQEKDANKSREGLWALRDNLSPTRKISVTVNKAAVSLLRLSWRATIILLATALVITVLALGINATLDFIEWSPSQNYYEQCLGGNRPSNALVAIDAGDPTHIIVYDPQSSKLCESYDTGERWDVVYNEALGDKKITSIAANENIYITTNQEIHYCVDNAIWETIEPPNHRAYLQNIAVSPDKKDVYIVESKTHLFKYSTETRVWNEVGLEGITGEITDLTINSDYFAISTSNGIWYTKLGNNTTWTKFDYRLKEEIEIVSVDLAYPTTSWGNFFVNLVARDKDKFLTSTSAGDIYIGFLTETGGLIQKRHLPFEGKENIPVSIAINQNSKFAAGINELFCEQSWTILDPEWWNFDLRKNKRCG